MIVTVARRQTSTAIHASSPLSQRFGQFVSHPDGVPLQAFSETIRAIHGAEPTLLARERVHEMFGVDSFWKGKVLVFELEGHPSARLCYAWDVDGRVKAVLHEGPVDSPQTAVRAAFMNDGPELAEGG